MKASSLSSLMRVSSSEKGVVSLGVGGMASG